MFQAVNPTYYILAKGAYAQFGGKVHFTNAPGLRNFHRRRKLLPSQLHEPGD
jgi:hypothetical protein